MLRTTFLLMACLLLVGCRQPAADFTAVEFYELFIKDWRTAERQFLNKSISIRGEVIYVSFCMGTPHDWKTVAVGNPPAGVFCDFPPANLQQIEHLVPGQKVVIRGICKGEFDGVPILSKCVVVE